MSQIPERLSRRDNLLFSMARLSGHVMYLQAEAARMGLVGLEEDFHQLSREMIRIEADCAQLGRGTLRTRPPGQLRAVTGG